MPPKKIRSVDALRAHLQGAMELEHATIPPYLCALYSLVPGRNLKSAEVLASVVVEEMLHLAMVANILNAVGGAPVLDDASFVARYPAYLPHSRDAFRVSLSRFSKATIATFTRIEKPEEPGAPSEAEHFDTIGQFYQAIGEALTTLCAQLGEDRVFIGDPARQITPEHVSFRGGRRVLAVYDLATALAAIDEIEQQGEGLAHAEIWDGDRDMFHPERDEIAHYFRFSQILLGRAYVRGDTPVSGPSGESFEVEWEATYPMRDTPRCDEYSADGPVHAAMVEFNQRYWDMVRLLHAAFNADPAQLSNAIDAMFVVREGAVALMQMPSGDGATTAGPSFEYVPARIDS